MGSGYWCWTRRRCVGMWRAGRGASHLTPNYIHVPFALTSSCSLRLASSRPSCSSCSIAGTSASSSSGCGCGCPRGCHFECVLIGSVSQAGGWRSHMYAHNPQTTNHTTNNKSLITNHNAPCPSASAAACGCRPPPASRPASPPAPPAPSPAPSPLLSLYGWMHVLMF